jgi:hypothetical protein
LFQGNRKENEEMKIIETVGDLITELQKLPEDASIMIFDGKKDYVPVQICDYTGDGDYTLEPDDNF